MSQITSHSSNPITGQDNNYPSSRTNEATQNTYPDNNNGHSASLRREFATQTPAPTDPDGPPLAGPRKGWGTPQPVDYDDLLRRKRHEEARYRRYDDDYDYYPPPRRGDGLRQSYSDPHLNRYPEVSGEWVEENQIYYKHFELFYSDGLPTQQND